MMEKNWPGGSRIPKGEMPGWHLFLRTGAYHILDIPTLNLFWLRDNRRLLSIYGGDLSLIDTVTGEKMVLISSPQNI